MTRPTAARFHSPTQAETALVAGDGRGRQIDLQGYGPARRAMAGVAVIALVIGAALPVRAGTDDLATGLVTLGALALIAGETEGNPLEGVEVPRVQREVEVHGEGRPGTWPDDGCWREIGRPYGKAWGYRAKHGCAPAPGHLGDKPVHHNGKGGKGGKGH